MSHQLSECPSCRRTFVEGAGRRPGRCRVCGTPLAAIGGSQKEAEVRDRLYGRGVSLGSVSRVPGSERTAAN